MSAPHPASQAEPDIYWKLRTEADVHEYFARVEELVVGDCEPTRAFEYALPRVADDMRRNYIGKNVVTDKLQNIAEAAGIVVRRGEEWVRDRIDHALSYEIANGQAASPGLIWYGQSPPEPPPYLVDETLPETGIAFVAGQAGAGKTFVGAALVAALIKRSEFAGRSVTRGGGVLWLAAEGENEIEGRVKAALALVGETAERQPFCRQAGSVPLLTERDALPKLLALAKEAANHLQAEFHLPLVAIVIDTIAGAAGFDDENSASETQKVLNSLRTLSRETGALVIPIDHHGKVDATGIRGSSAKGAAADAVLACLCDKDAAGVVTNRRVSIAKLRSGPTGRVIPFDLTQTEDRTTCTVAWRATAAAPPQSAAPKPKKWPKALVIFKRCLDIALGETGKRMRPFIDGPEVLAVDREQVRAEFTKTYPADNLKAKGEAFRRCLKDAVELGFMHSRDVGPGLAQTVLWLSKEEGT
jgi:hypothetical protein